jgi:hypothetical protein
MSREDQKARARALFKKEEKQQQERAAMTEYQSQQEAVRERTERLRAQRLARDAAEATKPGAGRRSEQAPVIDRSVATLPDDFGFTGPRRKE